MGGGLLQLIAVGAQDAYLTQNPDVTFFTGNYRRHTNFSMESISQTFIGTAGFGKKISCSLSRNGDLVSCLLVEINVPALTQKGNSKVKWVDNLGHYIFDRVEIDIGGQRIDSQTGEYMHLRDQLTRPESKSSGYKDMIGASQDWTNGVENSIPAQKLFVPLRFWFNSNNYANSLPLLALQYHEVKVTIEFESLSKLVVKQGTDANGNAIEEGTEAEECASSSDFSYDAGCFDAELYVDYIFLDAEERKKMATQHHEYLIEQVQFTGEECMPKGCRSDRFRLNFNHPVKALVWVMQDEGTVQPSEYSDDLLKAKLMMNGHDRFSERCGRYFSEYQPWAHWTRTPHCGCIYTYSFALKPEQHQPSGTCNFSRIDNAQLELHLGGSANNNVSVRIYAINYNLLRVMGGLGGLAYSS